jgi:hypothetical protein
MEVLLNLPSLHKSISCQSPAGPESARPSHSTFSLNLLTRLSLKRAYHLKAVALLITASHYRVKSNVGRIQKVTRLQNEAPWTFIKVGTETFLFLEADIQIMSFSFF